MKRKSAHARGYNHRWRRLRKVQLGQEPFCEYCARMGRTTRATVADHIIPHKGEHALLYDLDNLQSLCKTCHDSVKAAEEAGNYRGVDADGVPLDPGHHWRGEGGSDL